MFRISTIFAGIFLSLFGMSAMAQLAREGSPSIAAEATTTSGFSSEMLIGSTIWTLEAQPGWVPYQGSVLDFAADGTGVSYEKLSLFGEPINPATIPETFTWSITDSGLEVLYDDFSVANNFLWIDYPYQELVDTYGFDQEVTDFINAAHENGDFFGGQVEMVNHTISTTSNVDSELADRAQVSTTKRTEYSIDDLLTSLEWPGPLPRGLELSDFEFFVYLPAAISNGLASPPVPGDTWAVPHLYRPLDPLVTEESPQGWFVDIFTLGGLGETSAGQLSQEIYSWSATADGLVLEAGVERYTYMPIETDGYNHFALATYIISGDVQWRRAEWIARGDGTGGTLAANIAQSIPRYWQAGINAWASEYYDDGGRLLPWSVFGYSLADDGTSFRIFAGGENCLADEFSACFSAGGEPRWTWTADGETIVRARSTGFQRARAWTVLSYQPGGRAVVLEWGVWQFAPDPWTFSIMPRLTTLEVLDLSDWPEEWAEAEGFPAPDLLPSKSWRYKIYKDASP